MRPGKRRSNIKAMGILTRRQFAAGAALSLTARAYDRIPGANDRMRIGIIGCGSQAGYHMRTLLKIRESDTFDLVAVCAVFDKRAEAAAKLTASEIATEY